MSSDKFDLDAALADDNTPAALRDWAKAQAKQNKELSEQLAKYQRESRSNSLASLFKDAGASEKLAKFYPSDADASGEAVASWLKEHADVFGGAVKAPESAVGAVTDHSPMASDLAAMAAVQAATPAGGSPTPTLADQAKAIDALKMDKAEDRAALDAFQQTLMQMAAQDQTAHVVNMRR